MDFAPQLEPFHVFASTNDIYGYLPFLEGGKYICIREGKRLGCCKHDFDGSAIVVKSLATIALPSRALSMCSDRLKHVGLGRSISAISDVWWRHLRRRVARQTVRCGCVTTAC